LELAVKTEDPTKSVSYFLPILSVDRGEFDRIELKWEVSCFVSDRTTSIPERNINRLAIDLEESLCRAIENIAALDTEVIVIDLFAEFPWQA
jgi:hypothetical protein